jgi:hypothetical protein
VLILAAIVCLLGGDPRQLLEGGIPQDVQPPAASCMLRARWRIPVEFCT